MSIQQSPMSFPDAYPVDETMSNSLHDSFQSNLDLDEALVDLDLATAYAANLHSNAVNAKHNHPPKVTSQHPGEKKTLAKKKKPAATKADLKDRPKRALSAYNIFFQHERQKMLETTPVRASGKPRRSHGKVGFAEMAKRIGAKWKQISAEDKAHYEGLAAKDKVCDLRYVLANVSSLHSCTQLNLLFTSSLQLLL